MTRVKLWISIFIMPRGLPLAFIAPHPSSYPWVKFSFREKQKKQTKMYITRRARFEYASNLIRYSEFKKNIICKNLFKKKKNVQWFNISLWYNILDNKLFLFCKDSMDIFYSKLQNY